MAKTPERNFSNCGSVWAVSGCSRVTILDWASTVESAAVKSADTAASASLIFWARVGVGVAIVAAVGVCGGEGWAVVCGVWASLGWVELAEPVTKATFGFGFVAGNTTGGLSAWVTTTARGRAGG